MHIYDIAVVGAGPAGCMAAIRAGQLGKNVILIDRNPSIAKKIFLTGKGRCNITNTAPIDTFVEKFGKEGLFLRPAFLAFFNEDLINFFKSKGLNLIPERQGRVFPADYKARSVVKVLSECLTESKVEVLHRTRLLNLEKKEDFFELKLKSDSGRGNLYAKKAVLSTGGISYKATGSTGDGFRIAKALKHSIAPLRGCLVPLRTKETWVRELQGLSLKNVRVSFEYNERSPRSEKDKAKNITSAVGEMMFTHFGVSGPLILDLSGDITAVLKRQKEIRLFLDLKPGMDREKLKNRLLSEFKANGSVKLKNIMKNLLPQRLINVFLRPLGADPEKTASTVTREERHKIIELLKSFPLTITGSLSINRAMVTSGGVSTGEIDPRTMESRVIPGLYFAGEIIDGAAPSGGYNLQQAFSTGFLAGESASHA